MSPASPPTKRSISPSAVSRAALGGAAAAAVLAGAALVPPAVEMFRNAAVRAFGLLLAALVLGAVLAAPGRRRAAALLLAALATVSLLATDRPAIGLFAVAALAVSGDLVLRGQAAWPAGLGRAMLAATLIALGPLASPAVWLGIESAWLRFAANVGLAPSSGAGMPGLVASGALGVAACVAFVISLEGVRLRLVWILSAVASIVGLLAMGFADREGLDRGPAILAHWRFACAIPLVVAALAAGAARSPGKPLPKAHESPRSSWPMSRMAMGTALGFVAGVMLALPDRSPIPSGTRVAFLEGGGAEFDVPQYGRFGAFSQGMFGLLPRGLERLGIASRRIPVEGDVVAELDHCDVLAVINSDRAWSAAELTATREFVARGGRLLVLGDHTDVFGLMEPTNRLLEPFGIAYRFDSAYPLVEGGLGRSLRSAFGGPCWHASGGHVPTTGIGGSLALTAPAFPLVWSDAAFSDWGLRENTQGSFLGNYRLDPTEEVGVQVVVAGSRFGAGRVLVFGDTTAFQNGTLDHTLAHDVEPALEWLLAAQARGPLDARDRTWVGWLLATIVTCAGWPRSGDPSRAAFAVALAVGCAFATGEFVPEEYAHPARAGDIVVPLAYAQRFGDYDTEGTFVGPLLACARRSGHFVSYQRRLDDPRRWSSASAVVLLAPRIAPQGAVEDALLEYAQGGGSLILVAGWRDAEGIAPLLRRIGVAIGSRLLAEREGSGALDFVEPYPLELGANLGARVLAAVDGEPVIASVPLGAGSAVVVADTRFFSSRNMEGTYAHDEDVIAFTQRLLDHHLAAGGGRSRR
jgi:hypothetical protein